MEKNEILREATKPLKERNPVCQCTPRLAPSRPLLGSASEASRNASRSDERERRMYSRPDETALLTIRRAIATFSLAWRAPKREGQASSEKRETRARCARGRRKGARE